MRDRVSALRKSVGAIEIVHAAVVEAPFGKVGGFMHSLAAFPLDIKRWLLAHEAR